MRENGRTNWGREEDGSEERNITPALIWTLGSTQFLKEMNVRNLPGQ